MLKVGVLGVGGISGAHIPAWQGMEDIEIVGICDVRPEQMEPYPQYRHYTDFEDMLAAEDLDIVDICLPTYLHVEYSMKALNLGINVVCEKPISMDKADVARVYAAAERNNVKFMVAQVIRFFPEYVYLKECYDSKKYGKLMSGTMQRLSSTPIWSWDNWMRDESRSGLVPFDLHVHDLDYAVWAFGTPKNSTLKRARGNDHDHLTGVYDYDDFYITIESSWYNAPKYPFSMSYRFQFEKAILVYENSCLKIYDSEGDIHDLSSTSTINTGEIGLPKSNAYAEELRYFADCVINNTPADKIKPAELETVIDFMQKF